MPVCRFRRWAGCTLHNFTKNDKVILKSMSGKFFNYICWGEELTKGKKGENGEPDEEPTPHLQMYFETIKPTSIGQMKEILILWDPGFGRLHYEFAKGTQAEGVAYTKKGIQSHEEWVKWQEKEGVKDGTKGPNYGKSLKNWINRGILMRQGGRSDLAGARLLAAEGGMRLVTRHCNLQQIQSAAKFLEYHDEPRNAKKMRVFFIFGGTGTGKTHSSKAEIVKEEESTGQDTYVYRPVCQKKWWNSYDGEKICRIDDLRPEHVQEAGNLLAWLDKDECRVEPKYGMRQLQVTSFYITTVLDPEKFWLYYSQKAEKKSDEPYEQFYDRITDIICLSGISLRLQDRPGWEGWIDPTRKITKTIVKKDGVTVGSLDKCIRLLKEAEDASQALRNELGQYKMKDEREGKESDEE